MATKKKSKGVLEQIGDAVSTGAEAVIDAGSKAVQAVGDLLPTGATPPKRAKSSPKTKSPKASVKAPKAVAKGSKPQPKTAADKAKAKAPSTPPKAQKAWASKTTPTALVKSGAKASPRLK